MALLPLLVIVLVGLLMWIEELELKAYKKRVSKSFTDPIEETLKFMKENQ